jgi:hypothetical protein
VRTPDSHAGGQKTPPSTLCPPLPASWKPKVYPPGPLPTRKRDGGFFRLGWDADATPGGRQAHGGGSSAFHPFDAAGAAAGRFPIASQAAAARGDGEWGGRL